MDRVVPLGGFQMPGLERDDTLVPLRIGLQQCTTDCIVRSVTPQTMLKGFISSGSANIGARRRLALALSKTSWWRSSHRQLTSFFRRSDRGLASPADPALSYGGS